MNARLSAIATLTVGISVYALAQFGADRGRQFGRGEDSGQTGGRCLVPGYSGTGQEDLPTPRNIDRSGFVYARVRYHTQPWWRLETREVPWHHDYPDGDTMFPSTDPASRMSTRSEAVMLPLTVPSTITVFANI